MKLKYVLLASKFASKTDCIYRAFEHAGLLELTGIANAPVIVGHICGEDIYQVVAEINRLWATVEVPKRKRKTEGETTE